MRVPSRLPVGNVLLALWRVRTVRRHGILGAIHIWGLGLSLICRRALVALKASKLPFVIYWPFSYFTELVIPHVEATRAPHSAEHLYLPQTRLTHPIASDSG